MMLLTRFFLLTALFVIAMLAFQFANASAFDFVANGFTGVKGWNVRLPLMNPNACVVGEEKEIPIPFAEYFTETFKYDGCDYKLKTANDYQCQADTEVHLDFGVNIGGNSGQPPTHIETPICTYLVGADNATYDADSNTYFLHSGFYKTSGDLPSTVNGAVPMITEYETHYAAMINQGFNSELEGTQYIDLYYPVEEAPYLAEAVFQLVTTPGSVYYNPFTPDNSLTVVKPVAGIFKNRTSGETTLPLPMSYYPFILEHPTENTSSNRRGYMQLEPNPKHSDPYTLKTELTTYWKHARPAQAYTVNPVPYDYYCPDGTFAPSAEECPNACDSQPQTLTIDQSVLNETGTAPTEICHNHCTYSGDSYSLTWTSGYSASLQAGDTCQYDYYEALAGDDLRYAAANSRNNLLYPVEAANNGSASAREYLVQQNVNGATDDGTKTASQLGKEAWCSQFPTVAHGCGALLDIENIEQTYLVAVGERGHILKSYDGNAWQQLDVPVQTTLTAVTFVDAKHGWAVGHDATILVTKDAGNTWQIQKYQPELEKPLLDVVFKDKLNGVALGAYGLFFRTNDGGQTWQEEFHSEFLHEEDVEYLNELKMEDEEAYLDERASILPHFNKMVMDGRTSYLVGEIGLIAKSNDFGQNWQQFDSIYEGSFFDIDRTHEGNQEIHPLGLILKERHIYLVCTFWQFDKPVQLALTRIKSAEVMEERVTNPENFKLDDYIKHGQANLLLSKEPIHLEIKITKPVAAHLYETPINESQVIEPLDEKWNKLSATVDDRQDLRWWLLGFAHQVEVISPKKLRQEFKNFAIRMAKNYQEES